MAHLFFITKFAVPELDGHFFKRGKPLMELMDAWKIQDALETYEVRHWGKGYFGINERGHVTVHPNKRPEQAIDLKDLVDQLQERGICRVLHAVACKPAQNLLRLGSAQAQRVAADPAA